MKRIVRICLVVALGAAAAVAGADSPITSTPFSQAYMDYPIVKAARASGVVTAAIAAFLASPQNAIDVKAAVINALSWSADGKQNARRYCEMTYRKQPASLDRTQMRGDELLVVGYLTVMDDYFQPQKALGLLTLASSKLPNSYTVAMVLALTKAQRDMEKSFPDAWKNIEALLADDRLNGDIRIGAERIILDYMVLYAPSEAAD